MQSPLQRNIENSQNFLRSPRLVSYLLDRSSITVDDLVLEIGPGKGIITEQLARRCRRVIAVERDPGLAGRLRRSFEDAHSVTIREQDFLGFSLPRVPYKVFASIPFDITSAIVSKLTGGRNTPDDSYLVVQREAAFRFLGQPRESLCAILLKPWFEPTLVHEFRRTDFEPVPGVDVVMMRLRKRGPPLVDRSNAQLFRDFVVHCFTSRHPSIRTTLDQTFGGVQVTRLFRRLGIERQATPTNVQFDQWLALFEKFMSTSDPRARRIVAGAESRLRHLQARLVKVHRTRALAKHRLGRRVAT